MKSIDRSGIRLCALVPYPPETAPSQWFRIEQWLPRLRDLGVHIDLFPFADATLMSVLYDRGRGLTKAFLVSKAFFRRLGHVVAARCYDAVLIHRAASLAGPALLERLVDLLGAPIIFDFDDAIFEPNTSEANRQAGWLKFPRKTGAICQLSAHVVAGNEYLARYARRYNSRVTVVPTSVDTERYRPLDRNERNGRVVIGWTGSSTSQTYLEMFAPVLEPIACRPDVELRVISDREPILPKIPFVWRRFNRDTEAEDLAQLDIGIMPMPDDRWTRGKCSTKALQYMAMAIPAVCSPAGTTGEFIRNGENGLLARTPEEWLAGLKTLVDCPGLRRRLGNAGRVTIEQDYSMTKCAGLFARVIRASVRDST